MSLKFNVQGLKLSVRIVLVTAVSIVLCPSSLVFAQNKVCDFDTTLSYDYNEVIRDVFENAKTLDIDALQNVYVVESESNQIIRITYSNKVWEIVPDETRIPIKPDSVLTVGGKGFSSERFNHPTEIDARTRQKVFVFDEGNKRLVILDANMKYVSEINFLTLYDHLKNPISFVVNSSDEIYFIDESSNKIVKTDVKGNFLLEFGGYDYGDGSLTMPEKIQSDGANFVYVYDAKAGIKKYDRNGAYISTISLGDKISFNDFYVYGDYLILFDSDQEKNSTIYIYDEKNLKLSCIRLMNLQPILDIRLYRSTASDGKKRIGIYVLHKNEVNLYILSEG